MLQAPDGEPLLTAKEGAEHLGVTPGAIRLWVHRGHLSAAGRAPGGGPAYYRLSDLARAERHTRERARRTLRVRVA